MMAFAATTSSSSSLATPPSPLPIVIVSGAGGKTGGALLHQLSQDSNYRTIGLVRIAESKSSVLAKLPETFPGDDIAIVDITNEEAVKSFFTSLTTEQQPPPTIRAYCIATSASPVPTGAMTEAGRPIFDFPNGQPEVVDWLGGKHQIDACPDGTHVIVCSTMGGTNPDHPLNNLGRTENGGGMIVQYKRKAEMYLMNTKRLSYTIVHPSGLTDDAGGEREIIFGVDDTLKGSIPRQDVAAIMYEAVKRPDVFAGRSFDAVSNKDGLPTPDLASLMSALKENCDYSLGAISV
jgi:NAD(P)H-binding